MKISSSPFHQWLIKACNDKGMLMMRRVITMAAVLVIPVLLAVAGSLLAAPAGPPTIDSQPVRLGPGPDGLQAPGLEPATPAPPAEGPAASPDQPAPTESVPAPNASPAVPPPPVVQPAPPAPVAPPVIIDDDDYSDDGGD